MDPLPVDSTPLWPQGPVSSHLPFPGPLQKRLKLLHSKQMRPAQLGPLPAPEHCEGSESKAERTQAPTSGSRKGVGSHELSSGDQLQPPHLVNTALWGQPPMLCSPVTERSDFWALPWRGTSGDPDLLASGPLRNVIAPAAPLLCQDAGDAEHWLPTPLALPPDHRLGTQGTGEQGESQQRPPLQVALPRFVLKVLFSHTSTHIAVFICERGRIFLSRCHFWLFHSKKRISHFYSFLPASASAINSHMYTCVHPRTHTGSWTSVQQHPRLSGVDSGLHSKSDRQKGG